MKALLIILLILWFVSAVGLVVFVLLHSGKGTGLSDLMASTMYSNYGGSSVIEKNLDRITVIFAVIFLVTLLALMLVYPSVS